MNNFEWIKKKIAEATLPQIAKFMEVNMCCDDCPGQKYCDDMECYDSLVTWLEENDNQ